jgi:hypothetical protein
MHNLNIAALDAAPHLGAFGSEKNKTDFLDARVLVDGVNEPAETFNLQRRHIQAANPQTKDPELLAGFQGLRCVIEATSRNFIHPWLALGPSGGGCRCLPPAGPQGVVWSIDLEDEVATESTVSDRTLRSFLVGPFRSHGILHLAFVPFRIAVVGAVGGK